MAEIDELRKKVDEALAELRARVDEYRKKTDEAFQDFRKRLGTLQGDLKSRVTKGTDVARGELDKLEKRMRAAEGKAKELVGTSRDAWGDIRQGLEAAWSEMKQAIDRAQKRVRS